MMNLKFLIAAALLVAPVAMAHEPAGTPKDYCDLHETQLHDYGPPAAGAALAGFIDGGIRCAFDTEGRLYDGHSEFAFGGAWILVCDQTALRTCPDAAAGGSLVCFGERAHHHYGPLIKFEVEDVILGTTVAYHVAVDNVDLTGGDCGDGLSDEAAPCTGKVADLAPGLDGAYHVFVTGTRGHVQVLGFVPDAPINAHAEVAQVAVLDPGAV